MPPAIPFTKREIVSQSGPITLTIFGPDADWACDQVQRVTYDLHAVQSAIIHVGGSDFLAIERNTSNVELSFFVQCHRSTETDEGPEPELEVLDYYPTHI
jgi:hypothetical protein